MATDSTAISHFLLHFFSREQSGSNATTIGYIVFMGLENTFIFSNPRVRISASYGS